MFDVTIEHLENELKLNTDNLNYNKAKIMELKEELKRREENVERLENLTYDIKNILSSDREK